MSIITRLTCKAQRDVQDREVSVVLAVKGYVSPSLLLRRSLSLSLGRVLLVRETRLFGGGVLAAAASKSPSSESSAASDLRLGAMVVDWVDVGGS